MAKKPAAQRAVLLRVMRYIRPHLGKLLLSLLLSLVTVALTSAARSTASSAPARWTLLRWARS